MFATIVAMKGNGSRADRAPQGKRVLVTGGAGFIGSHIIRRCLSLGAQKVLNADILTYAGDTSRLRDVSADPRYSFREIDVTRISDTHEVIRESEPDIVLHLAAQSHVTRSEHDSDGFFHTNVLGTRTILEACADAGVSMFLHVSTDEVYGPIASGTFREEDKLPGDGQATNSYARSKALADDVVQSFADRLFTLTVRPTNVFGPYQLPEKAIARWVTRALSGTSLPVWGDGLHVRQWLHIDDCVDAIVLALEGGTPGSVYNAGVTRDVPNRLVAEWIGAHVGVGEDAARLTSYERPNHDRRYAVDSGRLRSLGWRPGSLWSGLATTIDWYRRNRWWWQPHVEEAERLYSAARTRCEEPA